MCVLTEKFNVLRHGLLLIFLLACTVASDAEMISSAEWFTWVPGSANSATGTVFSQQITANNSGTGAAISAPAATAHVDADLNGSYELGIERLGFGAPSGGSTVVTTFDLSGVTTPEDLVFGLQDLDSINGRGSITIAATKSGGIPIDVNLWVTEGQYKQGEGLPSAQALSVRTANGNNLNLTTVQGADNTSWGDSRWIFFTGLPSDTETITISHAYSHPNSWVSDSLNTAFGVIPEPSSMALIGVGLLGSLLLRRIWLL